MSGTCPVCGCEQGASLLCASDTARLERELGDVAALVAELDVTLSKQARIGNAGAPGLARERTPINVGAMQVADVLQNVLTTWARDLDERATRMALREWRQEVHPTVTASYVLMNAIDAIRKHPAVEELVDEVTDAISQARRVIDRPADRVYLGQCLVATPDEQGRDVTCLEEIWARPGASEVTCKVCGVEHPVAERRAWLLKKSEDYLFTVKDASEMMGEVGHITVTQASIRSYIHRNRIAYRPGTKLIRLGDLLAVVIDDGERKSA